MISRESSFSGNHLLFLIATPIGNLKEFSERALETIDKMDAIACEDTRNTGKLLSLFGRKKPLIPCHKFNEKEAAPKIIALIESGKNVAYMSDAGYPIVSDPGSYLVSECIKRGIMISAVNGPNAAVMALSVSGFPVNHFYFHGFLDPKAKTAAKSLIPLIDFDYPSIFYSPSHRVSDDLKILKEAYGPSRRVAICRELTKLHEEIIRCTLMEAVEIDPSTLIGEIVIVVDGKPETDEKINDNLILGTLKKHLSSLTPKDAIKKTAECLHISKNIVYELYLKHFK